MINGSFSYGYLGYNSKEWFCQLRVILATIVTITLSSVVESCTQCCWILNQNRDQVIIRKHCNLSKESQGDKWMGKNGQLVTFI